MPDSIDPWALKVGFGKKKHYFWWPFRHRFLPWEWRRRWTSRKRKGTNSNRRGTNARQKGTSASQRRTKRGNGGPTGSWREPTRALEGPVGSEREQSANQRETNGKQTGSNGNSHPRPAPRPLPLSPPPPTTLRSAPHGGLVCESRTFTTLLLGGLPPPRPPARAQAW